MNKFSKIISRCFVLYIFIVLFEGAIRKWVYDGVGPVLLLVRDFLAVFMVYVSFSARSLFRFKIVFELLMFWSVAVVFFGLIQMQFQLGSWVTYFVGIRFWLLNFWMALAFVSTVDKDDFLLIIKKASIYLIIMAPLVIFQHFSPPGHFINSLPNTDENRIFVVAGDVVRATGTFTFVLGLVAYASMIFPFALSSSIGVNKFFLKSKLISIFLLPAVFTCMFLSGSRAALVFSVALVVISFVVDSLGMRGSFQKSYFVKIGLVFLTCFLGVFYFDGMISAIEYRFDDASKSELLSDRLIAIFFGEPEARLDFSLLGYGIGSGANIFGAAGGGNASFSLAESEPGRLILEGGILGLLFIGIKFSIIFNIFGKSVAIFMATGQSLLFLCSVVTSYALLTWPISGQISAHAIGYIMLSITMYMHMNFDKFLEQ